MTFPVPRGPYLTEVPTGDLEDAMTDRSVTDIRVVAVPVTDQDRAIEFYASALNLTKTMDGVIDEIGTRWVEMSSPGVAIALVQAYEKFDVGRDTGIRLTTPDAAALHAHLVSRGATVSELLLWDGLPPMFEFFDIDGNTLYVME